MMFENVWDALRIRSRLVRGGVSAWLADGTCRNGFARDSKHASRLKRHLLCKPASYWEIDGSDCDVDWE